MCKRSICTMLLFTAVFSGRCGAQSINSKARFLLGAKASLEQYSVSFKPSSPTQEYQIAVGNSYGVWCAYRLSNCISLQAGYNRSIRNWGIEYRFVAANPLDPSIPKKTEATLRYNEIQVLAGVPFFTAKKVELTAAGGYGVSYLSSYREIKHYGGQNNFKNSDEVAKFARESAAYIPISLQANVCLTKHVVCRVEPYAQVFLSALDSKLFKTSPLQYGASIGICYSFQLRKVEHDSVPAP